MKLKLRRPVVLVKYGLIPAITSNFGEHDVGIFRFASSYSA